MNYHLYGLKTLKTTTRINSLGLGVFDGLHLGHQKISKKCQALLTFAPHPDVLLEKNKTLKRLTTLKELRYYQKQLIALRFNHHIAHLSPIEFLDRIILKKITPKTIVVGYDFRFGYQRKGDIHLLIDWAAAHHIEIIEIPPHTKNHTTIKSDVIRSLVQKGAIKNAVQLLGHSYPLFGFVIPGEKKGRQWGIPTANLKVHHSKCLPNPGVYCGSVLIKRKLYRCVIYIGSKPTFQNQKPVIEVHIPHFKANLYHQHLKVFLSEKLRDDQKFPTVKALINQIKKDIQICIK